ncbi:MAG: histidinol-phosphate transaminase [candidate division Zixibacteria bacterium]|jgi:histidinol-phosphate aminotransferase|nr:histidinol-phosphate transaminase [candidate division Zixibacteria bacterium]
MVKIPKHTRDLKPYKEGKPISELAREKQLARIVKLASNENPLGPSPMALTALAKAAGELHRYVDPRAADLVAKLAPRINKSPKQIIFGHGTDALLGYIVNAFSYEGDKVLTSEGTFIGIYVNTTKLGRRIRQVALKNYGFDLDAIADAISGDTRIIYLANPNNPTGTMFTDREFTAFMDRIPSDILVILDEAYAAYAMEHEGYPDGLSYDYENVIVTRTLSKVYGLAGLRVGYAVGPETLIQDLYKVKLPFEPNSFAQAAAIAALDDEEFLRRTLETNRRSLAMLNEGLDRLGLEHVPTYANFIMLLLPSQETARQFYEHCLDRGLIIRPIAPFGIPNGIRINSGTEEETEFALTVLEEVTALLLHPVGD